MVRATSVTRIGTGSTGGEAGMTTDWVPAQLCLDMEGRRIFDTALGILIGLRRCSSDAAFHELFGAAQRHGFPAFPMAWHSSISPVADQNPLKRLAPRNRPHVTNGVSSSRHLVDRRRETFDED